MVKYLFSKLADYGLVRPVRSSRNITRSERKNMIPVNEPLLDGNEKKYLAECVNTGWISSEGPFVSRLETMFAEFCGRRHGIARRFRRTKVRNACRARRSG